MYYIIAEKLIKDGDNSGALAKLDEVRSHRGITDKLPVEYSAEEELMKDAGIWLNAGTMYGSEGEGWLRWNLACPRARLEEGLNRFLGFVRRRI